MIKYVSTTRTGNHMESEFIVTGDDREIFYKSMIENDQREFDMGELTNDSSVAGIKAALYSIDRSKEEDRIVMYHLNGPKYWLDYYY